MTSPPPKLVWSTQQLDALAEISHWLHHDTETKQLFYLAGFAGTGKTTLAKHAVAQKRYPVFTALSGKAAARLREKGCPAIHIHRLFYKCLNYVPGRPAEPLYPADIETPERTYDKRDDPKFEMDIDNIDAHDIDVIVVDEASMLDEQILRDLLSIGKPILLLGDPMQLPPPEGRSVLDRLKPDVLLTDIHRQAEDNPIIRLSKIVRAGQWLSPGTYRRLLTESNDISYVRMVRRSKALDYLATSKARQVLCGMNKTRGALNHKIRQHQGRAPWPEPGERLVCLKNGHREDSELLNGTIWKVAGIETGHGQITGAEMVELQIISEESGHARNLLLRSDDFFEHFDFANALTVHKAQGSEWDTVTILDESFAFRADRYRWLYTAVTRARQQVCVVHMSRG